MLLDRFKNCPILSRFRATPEDRTCVLKAFAGKIHEKWFKRLKKDDTALRRLARGENKRVAIMFADLRNFTKTTAEMKPERIVQLLDAFLPEMLHIIIEKHFGMVDKILGDGIMAVFGHPYSDERDLEGALRAAADMHASMADLGNVFDRLGLPRMSLGIGMNYGEVLVCHIGSKQHSENTIIGQPVNLAAKMEDLAKAREVVLAAPGAEQVRQSVPALAGLLEPVGDTVYGPGHARFRWEGVKA